MKKLIILITILVTVGIAHPQGRGQKSSGEIHSISLPESIVELKSGDGKEKTETLCNICHSLDYITMQPRFARSQWTATVNKMIKVMGAPINEEDARKIINYLVARYGTNN